jgi:hypothetical protein
MSRAKGRNPTAGNLRTVVELISDCISPLGARTQLTESNYACRYWSVGSEPHISGAPWFLRASSRLTTSRNESGSGPKLRLLLRYCIYPDSRSKAGGIYAGSSGRNQESLTINGRPFRKYLGLVKLLRLGPLRELGLLTVN